MKPDLPPALWAYAVMQPHTFQHGDHVEQLLAVVDSMRVTTRGTAEAVMESERNAATWLLEALHQAYTSVPRLPLALPRSTTAYTSAMSTPLPFGYGVMTRVLDAARQLGWARVDLGSVDKGVTRIEANGALAQYFDSLGLEWRLFRPPPVDKLIILSWKEDGKKRRRLVTDEEDPRVAAWRHNLDRINEFLMQQCIYLNCPDEVLAGLRVAVKRRDGRVVNFQRVALKRTFSNSLDEGGRFYCGWWQNVPSRLRPYIMVNGWLGIECDYSGMALRCLYASEGIDFPGDPYDIGLNYVGPEDPRRRIVKVYINAILNDRKRKYRLGRRELEVIGIAEVELRRRVFKVHAAISHHFFTGAGLRMQYVDAQIAEKVMLKLMNAKIVCLPIHDSFIVGAPYVGALEAAMQESFEEVTGYKAKLDWTIKPPPDRFCSRPIRPEAHRDIRSRLQEYFAEDFDRFSISRGYEASWIEQTWTEGDHMAASLLVDELKQGSLRWLLAFYSFPLPLLLRLPDPE